MACIFELVWRREEGAMRALRLMSGFKIVKKTCQVNFIFIRERNVQIDEVIFSPSLSCAFVSFFLAAYFWSLCPIFCMPSPIDVGGMLGDADLLALSLLRQICVINVPHRIPRVRQICEINVPNRMFFVRFSTIISHFSG